MPASLKVLLSLCLLSPLASTSQTLDAVPALTPEQKALADQAGHDFQSGNYKSAFTEFQTLHTQLPANPLYAKFAAAAAVNLGDIATAKSLLLPVLNTSPDDPQALGILAHAYAQEHDAAQRDATLAHLQKLHDAGTLKLQSLVLEKDPTAQRGEVRFIYFLEPFSAYKVYLMARIYDASGKQVHRVTLESSDFDQPLFAREHPDQAGAGLRRYTMDGYTDIPGADGRPGTQTHFTYGFFEGRPPYDTFRDKALAIADGKATPLSSRSGIPMPPPATH